MPSAAPTILTGSPFVFGCYRIPLTELPSALQTASENGVTAIDSAQLYRSDEAVLAFAKSASSSSTASSTVKVGTKVHKPVAPGILYALLHDIVHNQNDGALLWRVLLHRPLPIHMWRDLEEAVRKGLVEHIGICNITVKELQSLCQVATVKPSLVQIECHPFLSDWPATRAVINYCRDNGIQCEAHSVLLGGVEPHRKGTRSGMATLSSVAETIGASTEDTARSMIHWVRRNAPSVTFCLSSTRSGHIGQLVSAVTEPLPADLSSIDIAVEDARSKIDKFRLYPSSNDDSVHSLFLDGPPSRPFYSSELTAFSKALSSPECVQQIAQFVAEDAKALSSYDESSTYDWPFSNMAFTLRMSMEKQVFRRVAVTVFGSEDDKMRAESIDLKNPDAVKQWKDLGSVHSCTSRLENLLRRIRILHDKRRLANRPLKFKDTGGNAAPMCTLHRKQVVEDSLNDEIPEAIAHPTPMPVDITRRQELAPFFRFVESLDQAPDCDVEFAKGAVLKGGHLDMCKQVVGPAHLGPLCRAVQATLERDTNAIKHFLLGNNVAFDRLDQLTGLGAAEASTATREEGIQAMLDLMENRFGMETWYLAGNCIDGGIFSRMAAILENNTVCEQLWLKRNPIGTSPEGSSDPVMGPRAVGRLLARNKTLQILDLHNTAILDAGIQCIEEEFRISSASISPSVPFAGIATSLRQLDLSANAITPAGAPGLASILRDYMPALDSIYLDINRLGDAGIAIVCDALEARARNGGSADVIRLSVGSNRLSDAGLDRVCAYAMTNAALSMLNVGCYLSTFDLGERFNTFSTSAPLIELIERHRGVQMIKCERAGLDQESCDRLTAAAEKRGDVAVYCLQRGGKNRNGGAFQPFNDETLRKLKQPEMVDHIYSIYRNAM
ncbi:hypothetical protein DFJ73DRAFT_816389 [Zopfochytrium polystomum]|nr:hypothetical protein DFJ73DRAFT_816389 [Zopfochytrium polystomum]